MISILAQERILGAALGSAFVGTIVFEQRRGIYRSIANDESVRSEEYKTKQVTSRMSLSSEFAHVWNKAVDGTLGQLAAYLSSRRW
ncbi:hypothetical protein KSP40_PGU001671 [Platanthera guangdongensis]|uniref:Uncharacterized protein n=1 Tax=Platanthera guangdongensis TaxID=2320717 RepID=A0ABR2M0R9_9ASPA